MSRVTIFVLLAVIAALLIFQFTDSSVGAQNEGPYSQMLNNQEQILKKLQELDRKIDVVRIRIR